MPTYDLFPAAVAPGAVEQMHVQIPAKARVTSVKLDDGFSVVKIIAGRERYEAAGDDPKWSEKLDIPVDPNIYFTVLVKSASMEETKVCTGKVELAGEGLPESQGFAPAPAVKGASPEAVATLSAALSATQKPRTSQPSAQGPVTPGVNEVAVLLTRGEAERLVQAINGYPVTAAERPALIRRFNQALGR